MTTISGGFVENAQFRGGVDGSLSRVDASAGADRVRSALDSVNSGQLSTQEKNVLMSTIDNLAADGYISDSDANTVVGMIKGFESTGRVFDTIFGGNSGQLNVPQGHQGWTPTDSLRGSLGGAFGGWNPSSVAQAASQFPSNPLFGGLLGFAVDKVVQTFKDALFTGAGQGMLGTCDGSENQQALSKALESADLSKLDPQERAEILSQIGFAALDGHVSGVESRAIIDTLNNAQDIRPQQAGGWEVKQDGGKASIDLGNYMLDMNEAQLRVHADQQGNRREDAHLGRPARGNRRQGRGRFLRHDDAEPRGRHQDHDPHHAVRQEQQHDPVDGAGHHQGRPGDGRAGSGPEHARRPQDRPGADRRQAGRLGQRRRRQHLRERRRCRLAAR